MKRMAFVAALLVIAGVIAYLGYRHLQQNGWPAAGQMLNDLGLVPAGSQTGALRATGIIEATQVAVSSQVAGRITALYVAEGDRVTAGQALLSLDDSLVQAQIAQDDAIVAQAQAALDLLLAGARSQEIAQAEARLAQAQAAQDAAEQSWQDAKRLRDSQQELVLQIIEAETAAAEAGRQAQAARLLAEAADLQVALWGRITDLLRQGFEVSIPGGVYRLYKPAEEAQANTQWNLASQEAWRAWQAAYAAQESAAGAGRTLADLQRRRDAPIQLDAEVNQAEASLRQAQAAVEQARAILQGLQDGATPEQINVADRALVQAQAARAALDTELERLRIDAPRPGLISAVTAHKGEVATPGAPLLELSDLSQVRLTVYAPEPEVGKVWLGQPVSVTVDSFAGRVFRGDVIHIADEAEFTPKNVYTPEERASTVFAVEILLPNPDQALKPGMAADALFASRQPLQPVAAPLGQISEALPLPLARSARPSPQPATISGSGVIEAEEVIVAAEIGAQIAAVLADKGQAVQVGQPLLRLDDSRLQARLVEADMAVETARANLAAVQAPPPPAQIRMAQADLAEAGAAWEGAQQALADAQRALAELQALEARIHALETQVALAGRAVESARAQQAVIAVLRESVAGDGSDQGKTQLAIYEKQAAAAEEELAAAQARARGARRALAFLREMRQNPLALAVQVRAAEGQLQIAAAAVQVAQASVDLAAAGPRPAAVAQAQAQLAQAEAARQFLQVQADKHVLAAALEGAISGRSADVGEMARPGVPLMTIADLSQVRLVIYAPQSTIGLLQVNQAAAVRVDAYPGRIFPGLITHIAPEAEFTPSAIQTPEERVQTVFAVTITLDNGDGALKPGMPADAQVSITS